MRRRDRLGRRSSRKSDWIARAERSRLDCARDEGALSQPDPPGRG